MDLNDHNIDTEYLNSYADFKVHELMLRDKQRNKVYREAIIQNSEYIKDKVVLDVGAGTGILSIFCAQAGASKVYAIEASDIAKVAEEIVKENKLDHIINVIQCRVETLKLNEKVDIIVSEWMGAYLLHEGMLDSVIFARDKFLKDDGVLLPQRAKLYVSPCSLLSLYQYWDNVNGICMRKFGDIIKANKSTEPDLCILQPDDILADQFEPLVLDINLKHVKSNDLDSIEHNFVMVANKCKIFQGICFWFDVEFDNFKTNTISVLSTSPFAIDTHWKQTVIYLPVDIEVDNGTPIAFNLKLKRSNENYRRYSIELELLDPDDVEHPSQCKCSSPKCLIKNALCNQTEQNNTNKNIHL